MGLDLLFDGFHGVAINEIALFLRVSVKIDINVQSLLVLVILAKLTHREHRRLLLHIRAIIKPV